MTHWRRPTGDSAIRFKGRLLCASACGRIVGVTDTSPSPTEADCPECERVFTLLFHGGEVSGDGQSPRGRR